MNKKLLKNGTVIRPDRQSKQNKLVSETDWNAYSGYKAIFPEKVIFNK